MHHIYRIVNNFDQLMNKTEMRKGCLDFYITNFNFFRNKNYDKY